MHRYRLIALLLSLIPALVSAQNVAQFDNIVDFETGLNTAIKKIREALGDSADNPRFVETLHRRGYRFIYPVAPVSSPAADVGATRGVTGEALPPMIS